MKLDSLEPLAGSIERITYYNPENGYSVIRLRPDARKSPGKDNQGLVTLTGNLPELAVGEHLKLLGRWTEHPKHGVQFQAERCEQTLPATAAGIRRYLGSGLIKGIGPRLAERIVDHFGMDTLEVIENKPEQLLEVTDIGSKRAELVTTAWEEQKQIKEIMLFLHSYQVSSNLAVKIYKQYGDQSLQVVQSDPYQLARDIYGVGFKTADKIAQALGLPADHPSRIEAGILYSLNQAVEEGNVFLPQDQLTQAASELLEVAQDLIPPTYQRLIQTNDIVPEVLPLRESPSHTEPQIDPAVREKKQPYGQQVIYLTPFYHSEKGVADRLRTLTSSFPTRLSDIPPAFLEIDPSLSPEQAGAIKSALSNPLSVLTGGPGTGKTTAIKALIHILESERKKYALASPTGRAAKRLSQATGRPASTIHRLLSYSPGEGFKHNDENPLPVDMLVVDEVSMMDLLLANHLLKALRPGTHLLFVGDIDQLPSVGAGDFLRDVIASGIPAVTRLNVIFRQAADSQIISNAHRINKGQMPRFSTSKGHPEDQPGGDFFLFTAEDAENAADWICEIVLNRIQKTFGFHPLRDIQVLSPMYRGSAGVRILNERLQKYLNPPANSKIEKSLFGVTFRPGDKLMQIRNNYDKDVYNGDIGTLVSIDHTAHTITTDIDSKNVQYDWSEADQLVLAYAVTVHKSQGSEFPVVVMPVLTQHYLMLQRNLLYTAITRAKKLCVLVGNKRAIGIAVGNNKVAHRFTGLELRLRGLL